MNSGTKEYRLREALFRSQDDENRCYDPATESPMYLSGCVELSRAVRILESSGVTFREVDEAPRKDLRDPVVDERNTDWPERKYEPLAERVEFTLSGTANDAKARQIVEAIRQDHGEGHGPIFTLSQESAVAMVAELMRPAKTEEPQRPERYSFINECFRLCVEFGMPTQDMMIEWLRNALQLGKDHARSRDGDFKHLREIEKVGEDHGFSGHPVEFASWLRATLEDWQRHRSHNVTSAEPLREGLNRLRDVSVRQLRDIVELAEQRGFAGGDVVAWLRDNLWHFSRAPGFIERDRLTILTAIWDAAQRHGWTASDGVNLSGFIIGKLEELAVAHEHAKGRGVVVLDRVIALAKDYGYQGQTTVDDFLSLELARRVSKDFDATERGRLAAIGELRVATQRLENVAEANVRLCAERDKLLQERDEARTQRDHVIRTMRQMRRKVGEIAEGAWWK